VEITVKIKVPSEKIIMETLFLSYFQRNLEEPILFHANLLGYFLSSY
jgi:hypothetical protein